VADYIHSMLMRFTESVYKPVYNSGVQSFLSTW